MNAIQKRLYMRKYMRKYYKKHAKKIRARANARNKARRLAIRLHREKTVHTPPTFQAHKVDSKVKSREKIQISPSEKRAIPVPAVPWSPTCQRCGMLRLDPSQPCRHCCPDEEKIAHKPPSPAPIRKVRRWSSYPQMDDDDMPPQEAPI